MGDEKAPSPMKNPIGWIFHTSVLVLGAVIALNIAVAFLRPIIPWLVTGAATAIAAWTLIAAIRWKRSRW